MKIHSLIALLASAIYVQPLWAQTVAPHQVPLNDLDCPASGSPLTYLAPATPCAFNGTRTVTPINVSITPGINPATSVVNGTWNVDYSGNLAIDGIPFTLNPVNGPFTFDASTFFSGGTQSANITSNVTGKFTNFTVPNATAPLIGKGYFQSATVNSLVVNSINVNLANSTATDIATGKTYDYSLSTPTPTVITGGNSTVLAGTFQGNSTPGEVVFGKLTGNAKLLTGPSVTPSPQPLDANGNPTGAYGSLTALQYNVTATTTTTLNADGLTTPTISVTNGINTNGSRISNLGAGIAATDAVNLSQLNTAVASATTYTKVNSTGPAASATGNESVAVGSGSSASNGSAIAIGPSASASGSSATALGERSSAGGSSSVAIGGRAMALGDSGTATGVGSTAAGGGSAFGFGSSAVGSFGSSAFGMFSTASADFTTTLGYGSQGSGRGGTAVGPYAIANANESFAGGVSAAVRAADGIALGAVAQAGKFDGSTYGDIAIGGPSNPDPNNQIFTTATGGKSIAIGTGAQALSSRSVAFGDIAIASGGQSLALGANAHALGANAIGIGANALANNDGAIAAGVFASAVGVNSTAVGSNALTSNTGATALGFASQANGVEATGFGRNARANGDNSTAIGSGSFATGTDALALGSATTASGNDAISQGRSSSATQTEAIAVGLIANAGGARAVALGSRSAAAGASATAIGTGASAAFAGSTAVGTGATTTVANQVKLGGAGSSISIGDVGASDAAQVGTEFFLTVDASGTVGRGAQSGASLISLQQSQSIADLQTGQALIDDTVATHTLQIASLGRGLRDADAGIAAAMALGGALIVPDSNISVNFNLATYRGQQGFSGALIGRIAPQIYVTGGFAGSTRKGSTGGRVGIAFGL